jgi:hypothetical protein
MKISGKMENMVSGDGAHSYDSQKALRQYLDDVFDVYIERLREYVDTSENNIDDEVKLHALLAEICKVKRMLDGSIEPI